MSSKIVSRAANGTWPLNFEHCSVFHIVILLRKDADTFYVSLTK